MNIGDKLKHIREQYGYSQSELSRLFDMPQSTISNYESTNEITGLMNYIFIICNQFKIPVWEFFVEDMNELKTILPGFIDPEDIALLKIINTGLDADTQIEIKKAFVQMAKSILVNKADRLKHMPEYKALFGE